MRNAVIFDARGEIHTIASVQSIDDLVIPTGSDYIEGVADPDTQYVDTVTRRVVSKSALQLSIDRSDVPADGSAAVTIAGIPQDAEISINGHNLGPVTDGVARILFIRPGRYVIRISGVRYITAYYEVNAT